MTAPERNLVEEIRALSAKLAAEGWDRMRGARLLHVLTRLTETDLGAEGGEITHRTEELVRKLEQFLREAPGPDRLLALSRALEGLTCLLQEGGGQVDRDSLPADPGEWTVIALGEGFDPGLDPFTSLSRLGFRLEQADGPDAIMGRPDSGQFVILALASWLAAHPDPAFAPWLARRGAILVAAADSGDFRTQLRARGAGARLLLDLPLHTPHLLAELAGLAWMPRAAYRVLMVDDDANMLNFQAEILRRAGFEVLALDDAVAARDFIDSFAPEACVLDVEMPACRGTDLTALLRREERFAALPVIYLSAFSDADHQLDARLAGGEDYLTKPVNGQLLITAVKTRARHFRRLEQLRLERRRALRELHGLKQTLDAHAIVSVAALDGTIIDVNRKFCEISGYAREELIGHNHRIVKSGHHAPAVFEDLWRTISGGGIWHGEMQNRDKNGRPYWVQSTIAPLPGEDGLPEKYLSIRTDVTELRRAQARLEGRGRLMDLLREVLQVFVTAQDLAQVSARLLDGMLHLTESAFGFFGEVLHDEDALPYLKTHAISNVAWDADTQRLYEDKAADGFEFRRLDSLFGAVLTSAQTVIANDPAQDPRSGGLPPGHPPLSAFLGLPIRRGGTLVGMVGLANRPGGYDSEVVEFLAPVLAAGADLIEAHRLRGYQRRVIGELNRARQDAEQALRTHEAHQADELGEARASLDALLAQTRALAGGLSDGDIRQRADAITRTAEALALRIDALAAERAGAPDTAAKAPAGPAPDAPGEAREAARHRILVAEDNPANRAVLGMQLGVLGYEADMAEDGAIALERWKKGGHALLLADCNMPNLDGLGLTRAIRAMEGGGGRHLPIIAISAVHQPEDLAACRRAGMDDVLPKPIELNDLGRMIQRWLPGAPPAEAAGQPALAPARQASPVLDLTYMAGIIGGADADRVRELVDLFTSTARGDLPACHRHLEAGDGTALALVMHKLKSSARMVGAQRFAPLAESLETAAKAGQMAAAAALLAELEQSLDDVEAAAGHLYAPAPSVSGAAPSPEGDGAALPRQVLVIDDDPVARRQIDLLLAGLGVTQVVAMEDAARALEAIAGMPETDLIITDLRMPGMDGIEFLRRLPDSGYRGELILSSGVEDSLLGSAAELARAKGMRLRGTLAKPATREALGRLLLEQTATAPARPAPAPQLQLSAEDILEGMHRDEFTVHFQPKVDAASLRPLGVEALARWTRNGKPVRPDLFIVAAERHGLIGGLSERLILKALEGGARLAEAGHLLSVAVNVSATWLGDVHLPEFIQDSCQQAGFPAEKLILEITETGVMADITAALDVITRLRLKGFRLSIDDFGTGYSSMEQLRRFPFNELKLDRGFIQGADKKPAAQAILASSIDMAKKLHLATVAEGVETQAELDLVRGLGCDLVQGWLVAKAMPADELIAWLEARATA